MKETVIKNASDPIFHAETQFGADRMLQVATIGAAVTGVILACVTATDFGGLFGMAVSLWLFTAMNGFVTANAISGALADFPMRAGAVSALMGAIQYGSGVVGSAVAGIFADGTPWPMGWVIALGGVGSLACGFLVHRRVYVH